jgi:hypothetical protein
MSLAQSLDICQIKYWVSFFFLKQQIFFLQKQWLVVGKGVDLFVLSVSTNMTPQLNISVSIPFHLVPSQLFLLEWQSRFCLDVTRSISWRLPNKILSEFLFFEATDFFSPETMAGCWQRRRSLCDGCVDKHEAAVETFEQKNRTKNGAKTFVPTNLSSA